MRYIEALLINNQQEKAETLNNKMAAMRFTDQKMAYLVFKGMIEWKGGRVNESGGFFEKALQGNLEGSFTKDLRPMAELMLGKVHLKKGDKAKAKYYVSKAIDSSEYSWVSQEAKKIKENL